jgi:hypothetical protein
MAPIRRAAAGELPADRYTLRSVMRPLAGILVTTLAICLALLGGLVAQMDQQGARQVQLMMTGAVETRLSALADMTRDYGRWDDAVLNLYDDLDREWAVAKPVATSGARGDQPGLQDGQAQSSTAPSSNESSAIPKRPTSPPP